MKDMILSKLYTKIGIGLKRKGSTYDGVKHVLCRKLFEKDCYMLYIDTDNRLALYVYRYKGLFKNLEIKHTVISDETDSIENITEESIIETVDDDIVWKIKDSNGYYDLNLLDQFKRISLDRLRELKKEEKRIKENIEFKVGGKTNEE